MRGGPKTSVESHGENIRVVVLEDEALYRDLLVKALSQYRDLEVVGAFDDGDTFLEAAADVNPQVALLDIDLPGHMNGIQVGLRLRDRLPGLGIVLLSNHRDPAFLWSLRQGKITGWSYLHKKSVGDVDALKRAIDGVVAGFVVLDRQLVEAALPKAESRIAGLSPRQLEILQFLAEGHTNMAMAEKLAISVKTVENHINVIYETLHISRSSRYHPRVLAVLEYLSQSQFSKIG